jgi:hypothetical protein
MEKIFVQRPQAEVSFLKKWIEKNGRMFEGTHSVTLVKTLTSQSGRIWWVVQDTVTGEIFRVLPGLFQELQEREADQEILVANESGEVTISEKIVFTIDREGMLQLA